MYAGDISAISDTSAEASFARDRTAPSLNSGAQASFQPSVLDPPRDFDTPPNAEAARRAVAQRLHTEWSPSRNHAREGLPPTASSGKDPLARMLLVPDAEEDSFASWDPWDLPHPDDHEVLPPSWARAAELQGSHTCVVARTREAHPLLPPARGQLCTSGAASLAIGGAACGLSAAAVSAGGGRVDMAAGAGSLRPPRRLTR